MVNAHKPSLFFSFDLWPLTARCPSSFEARKLLARARIVFVHTIGCLGGKEKRHVKLHDGDPSR